MSAWAILILGSQFHLILRGFKMAQFIIRAVCAVEFTCEANSAEEVEELTGGFSCEVLEALPLQIAEVHEVNEVVKQ